MIKISGVAYFSCWICVFALPNHDLFNYFFSGTPLSIWKQVFALLITLFALRWALRPSYGVPSEVVKKKLFLFLIFGCALYALWSLLMGLSVARVAYGSLAYVGFAGFLMFSSLVFSRGDRFTLYRIIVVLSLVGSIGIVFDYVTGFFLFLPRAEGITLDYLEAHNVVFRAAFLFGASTIVFQFLAFGLLVSSIGAGQSRLFTRYVGFMAISVTILMALFLTGSRAGFYLGLLSFCLGYLLAAPRGTAVAWHLFTAFIVTLFVAADFRLLDELLVTDNFDRFLNAFNAADDGNENRLYRWRQGLNEMTSISPEWFLGHGIGATISIFDDGFEPSTHFESSVFQAFYEGGGGLLILRYTATMVALSAYAVTKERTREMTALAGFLFLHFISTAIAPTFGAYHTQMVYFLAAGLLISLCDRSVRSTFQ